MKYLKFMTDAGYDCPKLTFYAMADDIFSDAEVYESVVACATVRYQRMNHEANDILAEEFNLDYEKIEHDEYLSLFIDSDTMPYMRKRLDTSMFGNPQDICVIVWEKTTKIEDGPQFWAFSALCGQDQEVSTLGYTDSEHLEEEVYAIAHDDLLYQLKRYTQCGGADIKGGLFIVTEMDQEAYDMEVESRTLVGV